MHKPHVCASKLKPAVVRYREHCESRISLWSMRITCGSKYENSAAGQALTGIKRHTPKQFNAKQMAGRLRTKGEMFQYQPVDLGVQHGIDGVFP